MTYADFPVETTDVISLPPGNGDKFVSYEFHCEFRRKFRREFHTAEVAYSIA